MNHVMIYLGGEQLLESTGLQFSSVNEVSNVQDLTTRVITFKQALGKTVAELSHSQYCHSGFREGDFVFSGNLL